ncbi:MAG: hypothetical protein JEZ14_14135 [Marinilabiliaceae bacterium]|nr:hypothetical protein [Marinilabiliaceae bacterium]
MKKKVLRVIAGATLMVAMAVGMQMNNVLNESSLMMENLDAIAMANGGEFANQPNKRTKNVSCIKELSITGAGGGTSKFGYRDKCKNSGSGCTPTTCQ